MSRSRTVRRLYVQFATEGLFGWYVPDRRWRAQLRELYPVDYVAMHHRRDFSPSMLNAHARRAMAFNRRVATA